MTKAEFTTSAVLVHMDRGSKYKSADIAAAIGRTKAQVREALGALKAQGLVSKEQAGVNEVLWRKTGYARPSPAEVTTSIAAPIAGPDLTRTWDGGGDWRQFAMLCMCVRRGM